MRDLTRMELAGWRGLGMAARSWRVGAVVVLSFSSGLPLGLVWIAIPVWLGGAGVDLETVGLVTLAQAPWTFKVLWAPLLDRFAPPGLEWLGRRRGWVAVAQVALFVWTLGLAGVGKTVEAPWVVGALALAVAFSSATQDIALDAYAVDVLRPEEQGLAVGARTAVYRAAMFVAGGMAITLAAAVSWRWTCVGLALLYLPMVWVAVAAPEPEERLARPATLGEAAGLSLLSFLRQPKALTMVAFVLFYKLTDLLGQALLRPFLIDMGYGAFDRGVALATVATAAVVVGTFFGGALTTTLGLGRSLWLFGVLQIFSNAGYLLVAASPVNRPLMYGAMGFESLAQGLGVGAFSVFLLRVTQKRFSATQYALLSSLFGLPRLVSGPVSGFVAAAWGWPAFFWFTMVMGVPGLLLLARLVPPGTREVRFEDPSGG